MTPAAHLRCFSADGVQPYRRANSTGESRLKSLAVFIVSLTLAVSLGELIADTKSSAVLRVGDAAPVFEAKDDQGGLWKSVDHVGKKIVVVQFYPADMTAACTKQACRFRDEMQELAKRGVVLIGVSGDSVQNHQLFKNRNNLNFILLADEDGRVAKKFGVAVKKGGSIARKSGGRQVLPRRVTLSWRIFVIDLEGKVAYQRRRVNTLSEIDIVLDLLAKDFWSNREDGKAVWMPKTAREWMKVLSREQYRVTRQKQTERPFTGKYWNTKTKGSYKCVCCGQVLFDSSTKFRSGTGWPSFGNPASKECAKFAKDTRRGTVRIEVQCSRCDAHLGHVFPDGPPPAGRRYCINSASLVLQQEK